ncbi:MAG: hypothetical protein GWN00_29215 [Aliifodinibius sp.]|nr:hypothetical protein [Fodinibius sp.]NIV14852.1 hypothetical protein [Fodinibius sp.]NIY28731.1 hypothetical protein [Fodinibius sp.]
MNSEDPYPPSGLRPEITGVSPDSLEGGAIVTINGNNFNTEPEKNMVLFGKRISTATAATKTSLDVPVPFGLTGTEPASVTLRVVVQNSEYLSDPLSVVAMESFYIVDNFDFPSGVAVDANGSVYVNDGDAWKVYKYPVGGGAREVYTEQGGNGDITFDAAGNLYICIGGDWGSEIYKVPPGGGDAELVSDNEDLSAFDVDFDPDGNMYIGGRRTGIHRITPDGEIQTMNPAVENALSVRVFDGYLYWSNADENSIERAPINTNGLGNVEIVFKDETGIYMEDPLGIDIDSNGNVYVVNKGWDGNPNLSRISPDGTAEVLLEMLHSHHRHVAIGNKSIYVCSRGGPDAVYRIAIGVDPAPIY